MSQKGKCKYFADMYYRISNVKISQLHYITIKIWKQHPDNMQAVQAGKEPKLQL